MLEFAKNKNILVLAAHPDDETLGCGGTLHKLAKLGCNIKLITFTDGESSRAVGLPTRTVKLEQICQILGIASFSSGSFSDNAMDSTALLNVSKFIDASLSVQPDIVFTHFIGDLNVDHQIVTKACLVVFRPQIWANMSIYSYYVPSASDYNPTTYFDGNVYYKLEEENLNAKLLALKCYEKEMRNYPHSRSFENVENLMKVWGAEVGAPLCEKFKLLRQVC